MKNIDGVGVLLIGPHLKHKLAIAIAPAHWCIMQQSAGGFEIEKSKPPFFVMREAARTHLHCFR